MTLTEDGDAGVDNQMIGRTLVIHANPRCRQQCHSHVGPANQTLHNRDAIAPI